MTMAETIKNTKVRITDTVHINDQEVIVGQTMAIGPLAPGFAGVTLTIFTEDFDVDWKKVKSNVEIIAPDELIDKRAAEVKNFPGDVLHGCAVDEKTIRMGMTLRIAATMATPAAFSAALEHMYAKGVPPTAQLDVDQTDGMLRISAEYFMEGKRD